MVDLLAADDMMCIEDDGMLQRTSTRAKSFKLYSF